MSVPPVNSPLQPEDFDPNGRSDLQALSDIVNGDTPADVATRGGNEWPNMAKLSVLGTDAAAEATTQADIATTAADTALGAVNVAYAAQRIKPNSAAGQADATIPSDGTGYFYVVTTDPNVFELWIKGASTPTDTTLRVPSAVAMSRGDRGVVTITGDANVTLSAAQAGYAIIIRTGTLTANRTDTVPSTGFKATYYNATTGAFTLTVKGPTGTGLTVTQGLGRPLEWNGTNVVSPISQAEADVLAVGRPNILFDAFNDYTSSDLMLAAWDWWGATPPTFTSASANIPFTTPVATQSAGTLMMKKFDFSKLGLRVADSVTFSVLMYASAASAAQINVYYRTSGGTQLATASSGLLPSGLQRVNITLAVPSGANGYIEIRASASSGTFEVGAWAAAIGGNPAFARGNAPRSYLDAIAIVPNTWYDPWIEDIKDRPILGTLTQITGTIVQSSANSPWLKPSILGAGAALCERAYDISTLAVKPGDTIGIRVMSYSASAHSVTVYCRNAAGSTLSTTTLATSLTGLLDKAATIVVPALTAFIAVRLTGSADKEILAVVGAQTAGKPTFTYQDTPAAYRRTTRQKNLAPDPYFRQRDAGVLIDMYPGSAVNSCSLATVVGNPFRGTKALVVPSGVGTLDFMVSVADWGLTLGVPVLIKVGLHTTGAPAPIAVAAFFRDAGQSALAIVSSTVTLSNSYGEAVVQVPVDATAMSTAAYLVVRILSSQTAPAEGVNICAWGAWIGTSFPTLLNAPEERDNDQRIIRSTRRDMQGMGIETLRMTAMRIAQLRMGDTAQINIALFGDSWTYYDQRYSGPLATLLMAEFGDGGGGWVGFGGGTTFANGNARPTIYTYTPSRSFGGDYGTGVGPDSSSALMNVVGDKATLTGPALPALSGVNLFWKGTADGVVRYRYNAGAWTTINVQGAVVGNLYQTMLSANLPSSGTWTLEIETVSGSPELCGVDLQSAAKGIRVHKCGATGTKLSTWAAINGAQWSSGLAALGLHYAGIMFGTNDQSGAVGVARSPWSFETDLQTMHDSIRLSNPLIDIAIVMPCENQRTTNVYNMNAYSASGRRVSQRNKIAFADLQPVFGNAPADYASSSTTRPWFNADGIHPEPATGGRAITGRYRNLVLGIN